MRKAVLDRAVEIETSPSEGKWESRAILLTEGQGPEVEKEFYGFGEDREAAEEMVEIPGHQLSKEEVEKGAAPRPDGGRLTGAALIQTFLPNPNPKGPSGRVILGPLEGVFSL